MTSFQELAADRYSVREFAPQAVEPEKITTILEIGRLAPTARNQQPQRVRLLTDADDLAKIDECSPCRRGAPVVLLICYDKNEAWVRAIDNASSGETDASIYTTHLMLTAHDLGLGACWVMHFELAKLIELFALPENLVPFALLPIGYASDNSAPSEMHFDRKPLESLFL